MRNGPGSASVTAIPCGATSSARPFDSPSSANFDAEYAAAPGLTRNPATEDICTIQPLPAARMCGSTARVSSTTPNTFVSNRRRSWSMLQDSTAPRSP